MRQRPPRDRRSRNVHRPHLLVALALLGACKRHRAAPECPATPPADAGNRVRTIAEVPVMGPSADRREVDVPLRWMHLLANPVPTGGGASVVVGAEIPCGYRPAWANAERVGDELRVRLRARWDREDRPPPAVPAPCATPTPAVQIVSLSVVRLGTWRVTDAVARDGGVTPAVTLRVVRDDGALAPPVARWFRGCVGDGDCEGGAVCARIGAGAACLPPTDPWRWSGRGCVDGATVRTVSAVSDPSRRWEACLADCDHGRCPDGMNCDPVGACVPAPMTTTDAGPREASTRHGR